MLDSVLITLQPIEQFEKHMPASSSRVHDALVMCNYGTVAILWRSDKLSLPVDKLPAGQHFGVS
jgi:hypothetical protein